jgi:hypothetical protein
MGNLLTMGVLKLILGIKIINIRYSYYVWDALKRIIIY